LGDICQPEMEHAGELTATSWRQSAATRGNSCMQLSMGRQAAGGHFAGPEVAPRVFGGRNSLATRSCSETVACGRACGRTQTLAASLTGD